MPAEGDAAPEPSVSFALVIHNHQPIGNFGWVIADVFERAYAPMVEALRRHPAVRASLHYSGPLVEWLRAERPTFLDAVGELVGRGQVEIVGGGWFEPILPSLPERDRLVQLERMSDELERTFGRRPAGAWLAERVWEPSLPVALAAAGYRWTIVDDEHFRAAGLPDDAAWSARLTEDQGRTVTLFATDQGLRYAIPFADVDVAIERLRGHATAGGRRLGMLGDDGEKFGAWPTTWEHCWGEGRWMERFLDTLEAERGWLRTVTPSDWLDERGVDGRVYVPTATYTEMTEWVLPPEEATAFHGLLQRDRETGRAEARWMRGGFWRNFALKYREVNDLHKQMLRASAKVAAMPPGPARDAATDELGRGQSNDAYWHGLFGGVYVTHLRVATFEHLIAAEDLADSARAAEGGLESGIVRDLDLDGRSDVLLATDGQVVAVTPAEGAGIGSWDVPAARHPLLAVMRRRRESYHAAMLEAAAATSDPERGRSGEAGERAGADGVTSIHEIVALKVPNLAERLHYDRYERRSGLVHLLAAEVDAPTFATGDFDERLDAVDGPFELVDLSPTRLVVARDARVRLDDGTWGRLRLERTLRIGGGRLDPWLEVEVLATNGGNGAISGRLAVEWNLMLLGGGSNPQAWWEVAGDRLPHDGRTTADRVRRLRQGNDWLGLTIETTVTPAADAWIAPIETISNSESGFEAVYQGSCLVLSVPVALGPDEAAGLRVRHGVACAIDRRVGAAA
ncbi:MAG TPA: alpha-amylase/4-alpha-glucanotransferase domain-containing protein [Candidatus Limnocylindrales bacterium]|nr:alpha-amylase/4-alpha-glucanotransferase domain-containing protein [Candidatus Limnocylindrales bacterium]